MFISLETRNVEGVVYWSVKPHEDAESTDLNKLLKSNGITEPDFGDSNITVRFRNKDRVILCTMIFTVDIDTKNENITFSGIDTFKGKYNQVIHDFGNKYKKFAEDNNCIVSFIKKYTVKQLCLDKQSVLDNSSDSEEEDFISLFD
uniref:Uncharacterized protein n=1 Tax=viral metagenome TaxID=1070528 RepID=A0A6C0J841_9ZZZZ